MIDKSSIKGISGEKLIPYTMDEMRAMRNAQLLNRNIPLQGKPMPGEDLDTYIQIYSELPQTDARDQAIEMYKTAKIEKDMQALMQPQAPQQDAQ